MTLSPEKFFPGHFWFLVLVLATGLTTAQAEEVRPFAAPAVTSVAEQQPSTDMLEARLKELEASTSLEAGTKETMVRHYRQALADIKALAAFESAAKGFAALRKEIPAQLEVLRKALDMKVSRLTLHQLGLSASSNQADFEQVLAAEQQHKVHLEALLAETDDQLQQLSQRGPLARQRLDEVRKQLQEVEVEMTSLITGGSSQVSEARGQALRARQRALQGESQVLDQELRTLPLRQDLLRAQREQNARALDLANDLVVRLRSETDQRRLSEATKASAEAVVIQKALSDSHPLLGELAEQNSILASDVSERIRQIDKANQRIEEAKALIRKYKEDYQNAKQKLDVTGLSGAHGRLLLEQRRNLPNTRQLQQRLAQREHQSSDLLLEQLTLDEQRRGLGDLTWATEAALEQVPADERPELRPQVLSLLEVQRDLLDRSKTQTNRYLQAMVEQDFTDYELIDQIKLYENLLSENLLWIPSNDPFGLKLLGEVPLVLGYLLSAQQWQPLWDGLTTPGGSSLYAACLVVLWLVLLLNRRRLKALQLQLNVKVKNPLTDKLSYSFWALLLVLLRALAWPLLLVGIWLQLDSQIEDKGFAMNLGFGLFMVSPLLLQLGFIWRLCEQDGVMRRHFHWPSEQVALLYRQVRLLAAILLPVSLVIFLSRSAPSNAIGLLGMVVAMSAIFYFLFKVVHPTKGLPVMFLAQDSQGFLAHTRVFWYVLALLIPLFVLVLAFLGYYYTVGALGEVMVYCLLLAFVLILVREMVLRWLLIRLRAARRAIWEQEWQERQLKAGEEADEGGELQDLRSSLEDPCLNLSALDAQTRRLMRLILQLGLLLGLWWIWAPMFPAFDSFGRLELWSYSVGNGESARQVPVTLGRMILALFIGTMTLALARNMPSLLEIVLFKQTRLELGTRHAYSTLTSYLVVSIGFITIFSILGGTWSEIQWLVAALSLGIGFGLQEIVANFISGLIILFERPIRVGDVVTVGDVSGVVSQIRIRATTITNWDRQELLVPNKEFITKQLLNWSLSDSTIRINIPISLDYSTDLPLAMQLMVEAAQEHENVMQDPAPVVVFDSFGNNTLNMILRCYLPNLDRRAGTTSDLNLAIHKKFKAAAIKVAIPKREIYLEAGQPLGLELGRLKR